MSWRDRLKSASFKDVPFKVLDTTTNMGRRTQVHEFPFREVPFVEDFGQKADSFTIIAYVIQNKDNDFDYFIERDNLIAVIREGGVGTLFHPFLGRLQVALVGEAQMTESFQEGGIARFTMTFVNTSIVAFFPRITFIPSQRVDLLVVDKLAELKERFEAVYDVLNKPAFILQGVQDDLNKYTEMLRGTVSAVKGTVASTINTALGVISNVESTISSVITSPGDLADTITEGFNSFLGLVGLFEEDFDQITDFDAEEDVTTPIIKSVSSSMIAIKDFGRQEDNTEVGQAEATPEGEETETFEPSVYDGKVETIKVTTNTRAIQAANRIATNNYIRGNALLIACRVAVRGEYSSFNEANDVMLEIVDGMDEFLTKLGNDANNIISTTYGINVEDINTYDAISAMRPEFILAMQTLGADLAKVINFEVPTGVMSTLELAYDKYEDLDRSETIFERNKVVIENPGFLPNLQTIEILSA